MRDHEAVEVLVVVQGLLEFLLPRSIVHIHNKAGAFGSGLFTTQGDEKELVVQLAAQHACKSQGSGAEEQDAGRFRSAAFRELVRHQGKGGASICASVDQYVLFYVNLGYSRETDFVIGLESPRIGVNLQRLGCSAAASGKHGSQANGFVNRYGTSSRSSKTANGKADVGDWRTTRIDLEFEERIPTLYAAQC